jgi:hypothetical protein
MSNIEKDYKLSPNDSIKVLISLVEIAHKKGAFSIQEAYLAFNAIYTFTNEKSYDTAYNFIKEKIENINNLE